MVLSPKIAVDVATLQQKDAGMVQSSWALGRHCTTAPLCGHWEFWMGLSGRCMSEHICERWTETNKLLLFIES